MTDLRDQLARLLDTEPAAPHDIDEIVRSGRRARRRHTAVLAAASTLGAAGVTAAVVVPLMTTGGGESPARLDVETPPSPTPTMAHCYVLAAPPKGAHERIDEFIKTGKVGENPTVTRVPRGKHEHRYFLEVCSAGIRPESLQPQSQEGTTGPAGPAYDYTEKPAAISSRLGAHLHERVSDLGLSISFTRPFSQETSDLDGGHPSYFGGNVDVHEENGYADIGVEVTHEVTTFVPFDGECTADQDCTETTLADGSVLRTERVKAGKDDVILTAEVHRTDGVIVHAQESNYPFGPDAGTQPHGDQPLTLAQLIALAKDDAFTF
jgi:hypothetical protein